MDDELNILPTSTLVKDIKPIAGIEGKESASAHELSELQESLKDTEVLP
jgi:hypothetical protein